MNYCPDINSKDFKKMVEHLGEDLAYHVWDKNGGNSVEYAPNGEKSIMFESLKNELGEKKAYEVAAKTHSKSFKEWFGDSKVVDKNGQPLVVYHGTDKDFNEFGNKKGDGFWFTSNKGHATSFGDKKIPVFLNAENPIYENEYEKKYKSEKLSSVSAPDAVKKWGNDRSEE